MLLVPMPAKDSKEVLPEGRGLDESFGPQSGTDPVAENSNSDADEIDALLNPSEESYSIADLLDAPPADSSDGGELTGETIPLVSLPTAVGASPPEGKAPSPRPKKRRPGGSNSSSWQATRIGLLLISITTSSMFYLSAFGTVTVYGLIPVMIAGATQSIFAGYFSAAMLVITAGSAAYLNWIAESDHALLKFGAVGYLLILELAIFLGARAAQAAVQLLAALAAPVLFVGIPVLSLMALVGLGLCLTVPRKSEAFPLIAASWGCLLATVCGWVLLVALAILSEQALSGAMMDMLLQWSFYGALPGTIVVAAGSHIFFVLFLRCLAVYCEDESAVSDVDEYLPLFLFLNATLFVVWGLIWLEWIGPFLIALLGFFVLGTSTIAQQRLARCVGSVRAAV